MLRMTPIKLCGLLLLCVACLTTTVMAFNLFSSSSTKKKEDHRLTKRQFIGDNGSGHDYIIGEVDGDYTDDDRAQEEEGEYEERERKKGHGVLYTDNKRIATEYTTVTGRCIQEDSGQQYYTQYNNIQQYFQMGVYGRSGGASPAAVGLASPFAATTTTCDTDPDLATIRNHWNAIFFGDYTVGGYQQTLGPLAVRGNFRGHDYVISTNRVFQCSTDVQLSNTAFVVGGTVTGQVVISRGMSYVGNLAGSNTVSGACSPAKEGPGPVNWPEYYEYWTHLSEALAQLMPTHIIDSNKNLKAVTPGTTHDVNVFTFNTCNSFNCPLWPGLLSTPDNIFSGYDTWDGPIGRYPASGTLLFNIPVDDGTTFNIDSIHPSINADYCRTIYNVYPADAQGNYVPGGHITIRRNTVDMIRGMFVAPQADIQDGPTGRFGGMLIGDNYSWQQTNGVEIDNWQAAANGAYYCSRYTGCLIPATTQPGPEPEPRTTPTPTTTICPEPLEPSTFTDCKTTVSQCTATACTETITLAPNEVTVTTTGDCEITPRVTLTNTQTITEFQVSTLTDCTSTETDRIPGPTTTVTVIDREEIVVPASTVTVTVLDREEILVPGLTETVTVVETEGVTLPVVTKTLTIIDREQIVVPGLTETVTIVEREGITIPPITSTVTITHETDIIAPTVTVVTCPPTPDPDCTLTDEFCLDTVTTTEPAFCTDYTTVTTSITCTDKAIDPFPGKCTDTETHCYPTPTRPTPHPNIITTTQTQTVTYVPGCDDYRYPDCDYDGDDDDDDDDDDYFKRKKYHKHKKQHWDKKKKMHDEDDD